MYVITVCYQMLSQLVLCLATDACVTVEEGWSWIIFYGHSPPFDWIIQEGLFSFTCEGVCTKYWSTSCSSLPKKKCGQLNWPNYDHSCWMRHKAKKQTKKLIQTLWEKNYLEAAKNVTTYGKTCVNLFTLHCFSTILYSCSVTVSPLGMQNFELTLCTLTYILHIGHNAHKHIYGF